MPRLRFHEPGVTQAGGTPRWARGCAAAVRLCPSGAAGRARSADTISLACRQDIGSMDTSWTPPTKRHDSAPLGARMRLTAAERMLAADREPRVTDTGTVTERPARLPTLSNARFAFKVLAKVVDSPYQLDVTGKGWLTLQHAMAIRDRLLHPKTLDDLTVTDRQIRDVLRAYKWFHEQVVLLLGSLARSL